MFYFEKESVSSLNFASRVRKVTFNKQCFIKILFWRKRLSIVRLIWCFNFQVAISLDFWKQFYLILSLTPAAFSHFKKRWFNLLEKIWRLLNFFNLWGWIRKCWKKYTEIWKSKLWEKTSYGYSFNEKSTRSWILRAKRIKITYIWYLFIATTAKSPLPRTSVEFPLVGQTLESGKLPDSRYV